MKRTQYKKGKSIMTEDKDTPRGKEAEVDGTVQESSI